MGDLQSVNRSVFEGPNSFTRDSMEDSNSSTTRKRPRLDNGEIVLQTMSTDNPAASPIYSIKNEQLPQASEDVMTPSAVDLETNADQSFLQSPSKMTINVRDRALNSTSPPKSRVTGTLSPHRTSHLPSASSAIDMPSTPPPILTSSPSPSRSPEIEVAELEEFDDDPRNTRWKPLHEISAVDVLNESIASFPGVGQHRNALAAITQLNVNLERGLWRPNSVACPVTDTYRCPCKPTHHAYFRQMDRSILEPYNCFGFNVVGLNCRVSAILGRFGPDNA